VLEETQGIGRVCHGNGGPCPDRSKCDHIGGFNVRVPSARVGSCDGPAVGSPVLASPTPAELSFHVDEIGWSLVSMVRHLKVSKVGDRDGQADRAQAGFDGALMHMRAVIEFLAVPPKGQIHATHYADTWDGSHAAAQRGLNIDALYTELNVHAAHLSRVRYKDQPANGWDAVPLAAQILDVFGDFINAARELQQELFDQLTEARLLFSQLRQI
jgi:hypothetical protein